MTNHTNIFFTLCTFTSENSHNSFKSSKYDKQKEKISGVDNIGRKTTSGGMHERYFSSIVHTYYLEFMVSIDVMV